MAILPFLVVVILFATGLIVKDAKHVYVKAIECIDNSISIQQTTDSPEEYDFSKNVNIIPSIASNPALFYLSDDENIVKVDHTSGKATTAGFGTTKINIKSQENPSIQTTCKVTVWDDKIHKIIIDNKTQTSFVPCNSSIGFQIRTIPVVNDVALQYSVDEGSESLVSVDQNGKITTGTTPGIAHITITSSDKRISLKHTIYIGNIVESIYFDDASSSIVTDTQYDLTKHIHTSPFDIMTIKDVKASDYFSFSSSNEMVASINEDGLVTFKQQLNTNNIPTLTATLKGTSISAKKEIGSTLEYLIDVSFNKYNYTTTLTSETINKPINSKEFNWSVYPTSTSTTYPVELASSNETVVAVENNDFVIKGAGQTVLSATIHTKEATTKTDRCFVNILKPGIQVLSETSLKISDSFYCCIGQYVNEQFKNQKIEWKINSGSDVAQLSDDGILCFTKAGTCVVEAKSNSTTSTITIQCNYAGTPRVIEITDLESTYKAKVGEVVQFKYNGNIIEPDFDDDQKSKLIDIGDKTYILKSGSESVWDVYLPDSYDTFPFIIQEDVIGVSPSTPDLWPYHTTNSAIADVSKLITSYPSTATTEDGQKIQPTYEITLQEGSISKVKGTTITFAQPEYADIKATLNDKTYHYGIKSQFGLYGKFILKDEEGIIQSGKTYKLGNGVTKTFTVDDLLLADIGTPTKAEMEERFRISSLNDNLVVKDLITNYDEGTKALTFSFTTCGIGTDVVTISNDTFIFAINLEVTDSISGFTLYNSDGTELSSSSSSAAPINSYSKDLNLFVSTYPLNATKQEYSVEWNGSPLTLTTPFIDLSQVSWNPGVNTLKLITKDQLVSSTYYFQYKDTITNFSIEQSVVEQSKNFVYVRANSTLANMTIKISDGLASPTFFKNNFKYSVDGKEYKADSNQINIVLPQATDVNPGCEKEVKVSYTAGSGLSYTYNISRDIVSKIVLPNHDNDAEEDKKGMQRVHVFGDKSYYNATEKEIDGYRLPIEIYDYKGKLVEDVTQKQTLYNSLVTQFNKNGSVTYEDGHLKIVFDKNSLYTNNEIFNNAFESNTKNQKITVATHWGLHNLNKPYGKDANVSYSFVVVNGVNCYVQEAILANNKWESAIVLQTNFGLEGATKDNQPFDRANEWENCDTIYGNGYAINFDAKTEVESEHCFKLNSALNVRFFGCNDQKLQTLHKKTCWLNNHENVDLYIRYCIFQNFYQPIALNKAETQKAFIRNSIFYNNRSLCISTVHTIAYIEDCGFFKCANVGMTIAEKGNVYLKGSIELYNFVNDELLKDIEGHDLSFMWPLVEPLLKKKNMLQTGPDGREYVNAYCFSVLENHIYFYKGKDAEGKDVYSEDEQGNPLAANHFAKGFDFSLPTIGGITGWSTRNPQTEPGAPSYYDEFDSQGNVRTDKLQELIIRLSRLN